MNLQIFLGILVGISLPVIIIFLKWKKAAPEKMPLGLMLVWILPSFFLSFIGVMIGNLINGLSLLPTHMDVITLKDFILTPFALGPIYWMVLLIMFVLMRKPLPKNSKK